MLIDDFLNNAAYATLGISEEDTLHERVEIDSNLPDVLDAVVQYLSLDESTPHIDLIEQVMADHLVAQATKAGASGGNLLFKSFVFNTARSMAMVALRFSVRLMKRLAFWALNIARSIIFTLAKVIFRFVITPLITAIAGALMSPAGLVALGITSAAAGGYLLYRSLVYGDDPSTVFANLANSVTGLGGSLSQDVDDPILIYDDSNEADEDADLKLQSVPASLVKEFFVPTGVPSTTPVNVTVPVGPGAQYIPYTTPYMAPTTHTPSTGGGRPTAPRASTPQQITPAASGPLATGQGGYQYLKFRNGATIEGMVPAVKEYFLAMVEEYGELTGKTVYVNSGYRSYAKQAALHRANPAKAAAPGRSLHEFGMAIDVDRIYLNEMEEMGLLRKYGFTRPVGGEPWHLEPAGIQGNINKAKEDSEWAEQQMHASLGRGGGGYGTVAGATKYRRNAATAKAAFEPDANPVLPTPRGTTVTPPAATTPTQVSTLQPSSVMLPTQAPSSTYASIGNVPVVIPE